MAAPTHDLAELKRRMHGALGVLKQELAGLRTGRASPHLLDPVQVDAYGTHMPLNQVATVSVPEPRLINVQVWDKSLVHAVEKAIVNSNLGPVARHRGPGAAPAHSRAQPGAPQGARQSWRTNTPRMPRVAVRHVRRDGLDVLKKLEKDHKISEDDHKHEADLVQKATDETIAEIDPGARRQGKRNPDCLILARLAGPRASREGFKDRHVDAGGAADRPAERRSRRRGTSPSSWTATAAGRRRAACRAAKAIGAASRRCAATVRAAGELGIEYPDDLLVQLGELVAPARRGARPDGACCAASSATTSPSCTATMSGAGDRRARTACSPTSCACWKRPRS